MVTCPLYSSSSNVQFALSTGSESAPTNVPATFAGDDGQRRSSQGGASSRENLFAIFKKLRSTPLPSTSSASGSYRASGLMEILPDPRNLPPSTGTASALCKEKTPFLISALNTAFADLNGTRSYAPTAPSLSAVTIDSSAHAASVPGFCFLISSVVGSVVSALPVNTGDSRGPEQYKNPLTLPATGRGNGRTPNVSRKSFTSTGLTCALSRYSPAAEFKSKSPVTVRGMCPK